MLSVRRPIEVVVLNCWVMLTNERYAVEYFDNREVDERPTEAIDCRPR